MKSQFFTLTCEMQSLVISNFILNKHFFQLKLFPDLTQFCE